jgi:hypothetical protein
VPAVMGMAVTLKQLSEQADEEQVMPALICAAPAVLCCAACCMVCKCCAALLRCAARCCMLHAVLHTACCGVLLQARKGAAANQVANLAMFLQQLFSSTAAAKGAGTESKRQAAVGIGCLMMKVRARVAGPLHFFSPSPSPSPS